MKAASSAEIKQALKSLPQSKLLDLCLRLARFKKENKELLTYLLFEADDAVQYIGQVKQEMDKNFEQLHPTNLYFAKKTIRKILRIANKHIRYTGDRQVEAELLLHFCRILKGSRIAFRKSNALLNLYAAQLKKIRAAIATMHEDLQYDYTRQVTELDMG
jgi:hypothetical protein